VQRDGLPGIRVLYSRAPALPHQAAFAHTVDAPPAREGLGEGGRSPTPRYMQHTTVYAATLVSYNYNNTIILLQYIVLYHYDDTIIKLCRVRSDPVALTRTIHSIASSTYIVIIYNTII
jgi:hypothetical protein